MGDIESVPKAQLNKFLGRRFSMQGYIKFTIEVVNDRTELTVWIRRDTIHPSDEKALKHVLQKEFNIAEDFDIFVFIPS